MIKDIFKYYGLSDNNVLNVFEKIDFSDIIDNTDAYDVHHPISSDNLMLLSHRFYRNIHDWWILYIFNRLDDCMFGVVPKDVISIMLSEYKNQISDYDNLQLQEKQQIEEIVRYYYAHYNDIAAASKKAIETLSSVTARSNPNFLIDFDYIITASMIDKVNGMGKIRIPHLHIVMRMKQRMKNHLKLWSNLNT